MQQLAIKFDQENEVNIAIGKNIIHGLLHIPKGTKGIVLFAHGSGSGRNSPRNQFVASFLREGNLATLLMDLLTEEEEEIDLITRHLRFDIPFLAERLGAVTEWLGLWEETKSLKIGYFGSSTGAAAALVTAAEQEDRIQAVVSRGGRPDLAASSLKVVKAPTLLIVGGDDYGVIELNEQALKEITAEKKLEIVPHATHLFEEPGTLEQVAQLAREWFVKYLK